MESCKQIDTSHISDGNYLGLISGMVTLSDGRLLLGDYNNACVKVFDGRVECITHVLALPCLPMDIANVGDNTVVVAIPRSNRLQFITVMEDELRLGEAISTPGPYDCVAHFENQLILAGSWKFHRHHFMRPWRLPQRMSNELVYLDMKGKELRRFDTGFKRHIKYITVNPSERVLYLPDDYSGTINCMTMDGVVLSVYIHGYTTRSLGMTLHPDSSLYICGDHSNKIHHITSQCTHIETLLDTDKLVSPVEICTSPRGDKLYISDCHARPRNLKIVTLSTLMTG